MSIKVVSPLDWAFVLVERDEMPWHAALLMVLTKPADAGPAYVSELRERMGGDWRPVSPYNLVPLHPALQRLPLMREVDAIDVDHHVRLHSLPRPGGDAELNALVGQLHSVRLDPARPLWELHLIDGLAPDRFAVFIKIHHGVVDGVTGMRRLLRWLSPDQDDRNRPPVFTVAPAEQAPRQRRPLHGRLAAAAQATGELARVTHQLRRRAFQGMPLAAPYSSPRTAWHGRVQPGRTIAAKQFDLARLKAVAAEHRCGLNDLVLYLCGTALRSYLDAHGGIPERSLTAGSPLSIRDADDDRPGSAFGFLTVDLGTDIADPRQRLSKVAESNAASKAQLATLSDPALALQTVVTNGPMITTMALGFGARTPAAFGVVMSNIPGPREQLYLDGARVDALIPVSVAMHNSPLNMTCIGHADKITFGIAASTANVPDVEQIADGLADALDELSPAADAAIPGPR